MNQGIRSDRYINYRRSPVEPEGRIHMLAQRVVVEIFGKPELPDCILVIDTKHRFIHSSRTIREFVEWSGTDHDINPGDGPDRDLNGSGNSFPSGAMSGNCSGYVSNPNLS